MGFRGEFRSQLAAAATAEITGTDPRRSSAGMSEHDQRILVATTITDLWRSGRVHPHVLMQMLIGGLAFLADNHSVSREQLVGMLRAAKLPEERSLLWTPPSFGSAAGDNEG